MREHDVLVVTLTTAVLYGHARLTVALFSWPIGVAPKDFDLGTEDYILISSTWLIGILALLAGVAAAVNITNRWKILPFRIGPHFAGALIALYPAFAVVTMAFIPNSGVGATELVAFATPLVLLAVFAGGLGSKVFADQTTGLVAIYVTAVVAVLGMGALAAWAAGNRMAARFDPANADSDSSLHSDAAMGTINLRLVLSGSWGEGVVEDRRICGFRLGSRVLVTDEGTFVESEQFDFRPGCRGP